MLRVGGGGWWNQLSTFDAEFKFAKIQKFPFMGGGGGWWNQLSTFDAEFKFAKIQNSHFHKPPPPLEPRKWKFQFRIGLQKFQETCGERWILVKASFDLGGQCLVISCF